MRLVLLVVCTLAACAIDDEKTCAMRDEPLYLMDVGTACEPVAPGTQDSCAGGPVLGRTYDPDRWFSRGCQAALPECRTCYCDGPPGESPTWSCPL